VGIREMHETTTGKAVLVVVIPVIVVVVLALLGLLVVGAVFLSRMT
jgi:flagellar basal body-associated protein FliL